jgi:hypothetical protein
MKAYVGGPVPQAATVITGIGAAPEQLVADTQVDAMGLMSLVHQGMRDLAEERGNGALKEEKTACWHGRAL